MKTCRSTNLLNFYHEGIKRISSLMQQHNFDHAFVIVDLLKRLPMSEYDNLKASVNAYCEIYPEETWALEFSGKKKIHQGCTNKRYSAARRPALVKTR